MALPKGLNVWRVLVVLFGGSVLAVGSALLKVPQWAVSAFQSVAINEKTPALTPSTMGSVIIIASVVAIILGALWVQSFIHRRGQAGEALEAAGELYDAVSDHGPPVLLSDVVWTIEIRKDYSVRTVYEWTWQATSEPVFAWSAHRGSDNVRVDDLASIRFRAEVVGGPGRVITIPTSNEPGRKRYLIFPHPPLTPGAAQPQRIRVSSEWPGGAKKLGEVNDWDRNTWEVPIRCAQPIGSVKVTVNYPRDGKRYETEVISPALVQHTAGTDQWSADFANVAPGTKVALRTRRCSP